MHSSWTLPGSSWSPASDRPEGTGPLDSEIGPPVAGARPPEALNDVIACHERLVWQARPRPRPGGPSSWPCRIQATVRAGEAGGAGGTIGITLAFQI